MGDLLRDCIFLFVILNAVKNPTLLLKRAKPAESFAIRHKILRFAGSFASLRMTRRLLRMTRKLLRMIKRAFSVFLTMGGDFYVREEK